MTATFPLVLFGVGLLLNHMCNWVGTIVVSLLHVIILGSMVWGVIPFRTKCRGSNSFGHTFSSDCYVTFEGVSLDQSPSYVAQGISWQEAKALWIGEARKLAAYAEGEVHVFQDAIGVPTQSIWAQVEYPVLMGNRNVTKIVWHVVMSNGTVETVAEDVYHV